LRALVGGGPVDPRLADRALARVIDAWVAGHLDTGGLETFAGFVARIEGALDAIVAGHHGSGHTVAAVTSGGPIGVVARVALGLDARATVALWRLVRNASVSDFLWRTRDGRRELSLLGWNHVDHLEPALHTFR
jgi:broad specificity phosphatase PhoE